VPNEQIPLIKGLVKNTDILSSLLLITEKSLRKEFMKKKASILMEFTPLKEKETSESPIKKVNKVNN